MIARESKRLLCCLLPVLLMMGCNGGAGSDGDDDAAQSVGRAAQGTAYVDPVLGVDADEVSSSSAPFKTITYALQKANVGARIFLAAGSYTEQSGEQFPLKLKADIKIELADDADTPRAQIAGSGMHTLAYNQNAVFATLLGASGVSVSGVELYPGSNAIGMVFEDTRGGTVFNSRVSSAGGGILLIGSSPSIVDTQLSNNTDFGLAIANGSRPLVLNCRFVDNGVGIVVEDSSEPRFSSAHSTGKSVIKNNSLCGFLHKGNARLNLVGSEWDDNEQDFVPGGECSNGENLVIDGVGFVDYRYIPDKNILLFPGVEEVELLSPLFGELVFNGSPEFLWFGPANSLAFLAIFDSPPLVSDKKVANLNDIVWVWHSGLDSGRYGVVSYDQGYKPVEGDVENLQPAQALVIGKSYYWAVWEWDESGTRISASSPVYYFVPN